MITLTALATVLGAMFLVGSILFLRAYAFDRMATKVRARIVSRSVGKRTNLEQVRTTSFVVEIKNSKGALIQVALAESLGPALIDKLVEEDGTIAVKYNPAKPEIVRADSGFVTYMIAAYLCVPGLLFLLASSYVWLAT
jgi:hypothetical protein